MDYLAGNVQLVIAIFDFMKDSSVKFDHQFCERLNQEYRKLHNNNYAMLGDLKYFFYFTPQNFELYEILSAISNKSYMKTWKNNSELKIEDILIELWKAMNSYGFIYRRFRKKQLTKALDLYR